MWAVHPRARARPRLPAREASRPRVRARLRPVNRVDVVLGVVFVLAAAFYLWTAGTSTPFTFNNGGVDRYNLLATAFLHLRLSVGSAPATLLHLSEPFNPAQNAQIVAAAVNDATNLHDDLLAGGHLYFIWGPAPALVLLVPLHLLGLEPSASVTVACFAVVGLAFALATLRLLLAQLGGVPLWMCVLAAAALALCSTIPFLLRTPAVSEDTIAGGYCFTMAGVWLLASVLAGAGARADGGRLSASAASGGLAEGGHLSASVASGARADSERSSASAASGARADSERSSASAASGGLAEGGHLSASAASGARADGERPSASATRARPLVRVALASLCFGLAAGSRPPLALAAVTLVPACLALRSTQPRRRLWLAAAVPVGVCLALLAGYNQARFGDPLEFGSRHQLAGYDPLHERFASLGYVPAGVWFYTLAPPRPTAVFPFAVIGPQPLTPPPWSLPAGYGTEMTGGLLPMTPILVLLPALVWIWRRRPGWLGPLGPLLVAVAGAGAAILVLVTYETFAATERYEVDFTALLLLAGVAAWLALARFTRGPLRALVRVGGGLLVAWGCATGLAISFIGYGDFLAVEHPGTYFALQRLTSPLSAAVALVAGRPVLAEALTKNVREFTPESYGTLDTRGERSFWLGAEERANLVIVSPDSRPAALSVEISPGTESPLGAGLGGIRVGGAPVAVTLVGPHQAPVTYQVPSGFHERRLPLRLAPGVNRFELRPVSNTFTLPNRREPAAASVLLVGKLSLERGR